MATRENLNKLTKTNLRQLASEQGIDTSKKKKEELVQEVLNCNLPESTLTPVLDQSFSLQICPSASGDDNKILPPFNKVSYQKQILIPLNTITFTDIYQFMISRTTQAGGSVKNFKGLDKAVRHWDAGDVQDVLFAKIDEVITYVKSSCHASMKRHLYQVFLCISNAGLGQACSHIGAVLFALSNAKRCVSEEEPSCTSVLCTWKGPRGNVKPQPLKACTHGKPKINMLQDNAPITAIRSTGTCPPKQTDFDPRHSDDRNFNLASSLKQLHRLQEIFPKTDGWSERGTDTKAIPRPSFIFGMASLWNIPDEAPTFCNETEVETSPDPLFLKMESMIYASDNIPPPSIDLELVSYIGSQTREQRLSEIWKQLHKGRITSSIFGDVLRAGSRPFSLIKQIVDGSNLEKYSKMPKSIQWGIDNEENARLQYTILKKATSDLEEFKVKSTGLTLCKTHSFLGASSDGQVAEGDDIGILEIKCPYSMNGINIHEMEINDILNLNDKSFCLEGSDNGPLLRKDHKYYSQVQGEMAIMGLPWCDFVVWTAAPVNNICIDRVMFDVDFVTDMMPKLVTFYMNHIFPVYCHEHFSI